MFESAEVGAAVDKKEWERDAPRLREALLAAQKKLAGSGQSAVVIVGGVEGAGRSETVNLLLGWLDARGLRVHTFGEACEETEYPEYWKFWNALPAAGRMSIFLGSWYTQAVVDRAFGRSSRAGLEVALDRIIEFERMLVQEGTIVVKFWMHLSKKAQKKRLRALEEDPLTRFRVTKTDWKYFKRYDRFREASEHALRRTGTGHSPWHIVEAEDDRYRGLTVARTLAQRLEDGLVQAAGRAARIKALPRAPLPVPREPNLLSQLDLDAQLEEGAYARKLLKLEGKLSALTRALRGQGRSAIFAFEGPDAAGKGGAIRRLTAAMDARLYEVKSVAAPTDEERGHPYLWRFWRALPRKGRVTVYDRSWYGRVLVERIEGFAAADDWQRAFAEINGFEEQLHESGTVVAKFWLAISAEEQLRRFKDREVTPYKQYKITEEDWRNRAKWKAYEAAACEMFEKTSTGHSPWHLVAANDKRRARLEVLQNAVHALEQSL